MGYLKDLSLFMSQLEPSSISSSSHHLKKRSLKKSINLSPVENLDQDKEKESLLKEEIDLIMKIQKPHQLLKDPSVRLLNSFHVPDMETLNPLYYTTVEHLLIPLCL